MEPLSVEKFLESHGVTLDSIQIIRISDRFTRKPDTLISLDTYLSQKGIDEDGLQITRTSVSQLWLAGLSKWRQPKARSIAQTSTEVSTPHPKTAQPRPWLWTLIVISQFWWIAFLGLPAKAQCHDEASQNWLQFSIEFIQETLKM